MELYINPLSANGQCKTIAESENLIQQLYENIRFCIVLVDSGNLKIFYDPHIECREIVMGQSFSQTLGGIHPDKRRLWYTYKTKYTKKLSVNSDMDTIVVNLNGALQGNVHVNLFDESKKWLSFSCASLQSGCVVAMSKGVLKNIINFFSIECIKNIVPIYESNPKHRRSPYISASGEEVSPMPKSDCEAQNLLFASKVVQSNPDKWAYCNKSNEFYRFKRTYPNREIYHGFLSPISEVPEEIKLLLR